ncbi:ATP-dependent zinc metalloprotease FtsH [Halovulum dunhuangense]|uniref:ATP-dependent zinc metalloprotease FtsH n=1 Tax=Halovulum dunhuangense TaxID=1505036 RepID=A0A849L0R9_9RHOB|nr:ATP-dependent zinc metalloprotease FtsH [Halovulum dunhuangense]NNU79864.1 ATP-dependent zinc metalloprotease FtsH [Halovulum dunhuangense]
MAPASKQQDDPPQKLPPNAVWLAAAAFLMLVALMSSWGARDVGTTDVSYTEIKAAIAAGGVEGALLAPDAITLMLETPRADGSTLLRAVTPAQGDPELLPLLERSGIDVTAEQPPEASILAYMLPWVVVLGVYLWLQRRMMGNITGGMGAGGPAGLFKGRFMEPQKPSRRITFADVAGQDQAKREVAELVDFLREPERFQKVGAEVPHGVLLVGPPGTGKTMLAKALAGEADVPFFSTSGSEFIEVFVGVGAGRVRRMFEAARKAAPSIIFIDELDSIGRVRGTGLGGGHDEREQTLNQILAELDGFGGREAVVVLAATNRPDVLDPALLRPGRFDRHVTLELPDRTARRRILDIHARNLPLRAMDDLDLIAAGTPGFSGADLKNLLNEAAIGAARRNAAEILRTDLEEARDKVMMGTVRTLAIQPDERHRLAVHEAGHATVTLFIPEADPLYKVTIIPRGRSLGGTHMLPQTERHTLPEGYLCGQLAVLLAGRAAERLLLGSASSGADDDIRRATELARSMIARWGMSETLGPIDLREEENHPFLGRSIAEPRSHADQTAAAVDREVIALLQQADATATEILSAHRQQVEALAQGLEREETLDADRVAQMLGVPPSGRALPG